MTSMKTSTKVVIAAIVCNILYTAAAFVLQFVTQLEISPTLTTCWFAFWGVEVGALAGIKICKTRYTKESEETDYD